jgi:hypothetical protein
VGGGVSVRRQAIRVTFDDASRRLAEATLARAYVER